MTSLSRFSVMLPSLYYRKTFWPPQPLHPSDHSEAILKETISRPPPTRPAWLNISSKSSNQIPGLWSMLIHIFFLGKFVLCSSVGSGGREDLTAADLAGGWGGGGCLQFPIRLCILFWGHRSFQTKHTTMCLTSLRPTATIPVDTWLGSHPVIASGCVLNPLYRKENVKKYTIGYTIWQSVSCSSISSCNQSTMAAAYFCWSKKT